MRRIGSLSVVEQKFLSATGLRADEDFAALARELNIPAHQLQYAYRSLVNRGIIRGRLALIDYSRLGKLSASCILTITPYTAGVRKNFKSLIAREKAISWASELLGDGQIGIQLFATSLAEVRDTIGALQDKINVSLLGHKIAIRLRHATLERKFIDSNPQHLRRVLYAASGEAPTKEKLDTLDTRCLASLAEPNFYSTDALAKGLSESKATIHRRIARLRSIGIIQGYHWSLDFQKLGIQRFRLMIRSQHLNTAFAKKLEQIAQQTPSVANYAICFGDWDYELSLELSSSSDVHTVTAEIIESIGGASVQYSLSQNLDYIKYSFSSL